MNHDQPAFFNDLGACLRSHLNTQLAACRTSAAPADSPLSLAIGNYRVSRQRTRARNGSCMQHVRTSASQNCCALAGELRSSGRATGERESSRSRVADSASTGSSRGPQRNSASCSLPLWIFACCLRCILHASQTVGRDSTSEAGQQRVTAETSQPACRPAAPGHAPRCS